MIYLKLFENFKVDNIDTKELLHDIISLNYILEEYDNDIKIYYSVIERIGDDVANNYLIGDNENILDEIKKLEEYEDFPSNIYSYDISFKTENLNLIDEYFNKLSLYLESYGVKVEKVENYRYKKELRKYNPRIRVYVEKRPDDYGKEGPNELNELNESDKWPDLMELSDDDIIEVYGLYKEDIYDMFYGVTDSVDFPEIYKLDVNLTHTWYNTGKGTRTKPIIERKARIRVEISSDQKEDLIKLKSNEEFLDILRIAKIRLEEYNWKFDHYSIDNNHSYQTLILNFDKF